MSFIDVRDFALSAELQAVLHSKKQPPHIVRVLGGRESPDPDNVDDQRSRYSCQWQERERQRGRRNASPRRRRRGAGRRNKSFTRGRFDACAYAAAPASGYAVDQGGGRGPIARNELVGRGRAQRSEQNIKSQDGGADMRLRNAGVNDAR